MSVLWELGLSGSCRDGWKDMGVWGGLRPPHTPNFLPLPAIPREPHNYVVRQGNECVILLA